MISNIKCSVLTNMVLILLSSQRVNGLTGKYPSILNISRTGRVAFK